ncbi:MULTISPECIES: lipopolysaccharide assembly protein LapA domain-containing protein [Amycolatopsis]|uniref:Lipopolysaccharide assembly protein A domain-containing protein n=1 Tax=Amycolatopsis tucumanensis TaxID=401106 RepID=A0ABP7HID4_9PSEU|nr:MULTISPECIES: lipopolysaccharide assembly protein LapA domain-containing protein [Amycolatopsis]MCF6420693.1 lipopolysaccharide assembly protein LapA domain-containing protein [Amycolatopsis tucumanensis]
MTARPDGAPKAPPSKKVPVKLIAAAVLVALGLTFVLQNRQTVDIRVFTTTITGPLWAALAGVLVLGLLAGLLLGRGAHRAKRGQRPG